MSKICKKCQLALPLENFSKHSGTKDKLDQRCKTCVNKTKQERKRKNATETFTEYPIYTLDLESREWQAGKYAGSVLQRIDNSSNAERYEVRIVIDGSKKLSKSFAFSKYESPEHAKMAAEEFQRQKSDELGLTRNKIRVIDNQTIEVQLTKGYVMKTDLQYHEICQRYNMYSSKSGSENSEYYAYFDMKLVCTRFHKHITGFEMTDHINRNPMDNRMCNLRSTNHKMNNNNRGMNKKCDPDHIMGIRLMDGYWEARIKQDDKEYSKTFSIKDHGFDKAKELAIKQRKELCRMFDCHNG